MSESELELVHVSESVSYTCGFKYSDIRYQWIIQLLELTICKEDQSRQRQQKLWPHPQIAAIPYSWRLGTLSMQTGPYLKRCQVCKIDLKLIARCYWFLVLWMVHNCSEVELLPGCWHYNHILFNSL